MEKHGKGKTRDEESGRKVGGEAGGKEAGKRKLGRNCGGTGKVGENVGGMGQARRARDRAESVRLERGIGGGSKAGTSMETRKKHGGEAERGGTGEQFKLGGESLRKRSQEETEERKGEAWAEKRRGQSRGCGAWRIWNGGSGEVKAALRECLEEGEEKRKESCGCGEEKKRTSL